MNKHLNHKVAIRFTDVYFTYKNIEILNNVSFHIHENEFVTFIGPNGAGKTTLLKLILGLIRPVRGKIEVFDREPKNNLLNIGYIPQSINTDSVFPINVEEVIMMGLLRGFESNKKNLIAIDRVLDLLDIKDVRKRQYSELSGGQKRRVLLARALVSNPKMLILDEPTTNMDLESEKRVFEILANLKGKKTILIVTHDTTFVSELTDVVFCIGRDKTNEHSLLKHAFESTGFSSTDLYGGKVLKVLHNTKLPDDFNCLKDQMGDK